MTYIRETVRVSKFSEFSNAVHYCIDTLFEKYLFTSSLERSRLISCTEVHRCLVDIFKKCTAFNSLEESADPFVLVAHFASPLLALDLLTWLANVHLHSSLPPYAHSNLFLTRLSFMLDFNQNNGSSFLLKEF